MMNIEILTIIFVLAILVVFIPGTPIYVTLGSVGLIFSLILWGPRYLQVLYTSTSASMFSYLLIAIPLFLFMSNMLRQSGLGDAMFRTIHLWVGRLPGGLLIAAIIVCTLMAAMVGSIGPGIVSMSTVALPAMLKRGYNRNMSIGAIMAAGTLAQLIPPSISMVIYASIAQISLGKLFAGGIGPGLLLSLFYMLYVFIRCKINPQLGPPVPIEEQGSLKERIINSRHAVTALFLILAVLGSIFAGIATPTEAAAIGGVAAIMVSLLYRKFGWKSFRGASLDTFKVTATIGWLIVGATVFINIYMLMGGVHLLEGLLDRFGIGPWTFVIMSMIIMMILGCFMDDFIIIVLCTPLFVPVAVHFGFDPIWYGILMMINIQIAFCSPPYGFALFYMKAAAPKGVDMGEIYKSILPYLGLQVAALAAIMVFPQIATWLPNIVMK